jgi:hypothetical protein
MLHVWERKMHTGIRWGNVKERDSMENLGVDGIVRVELVLKIWNSWKWSGFICPQDKWLAVMKTAMNVRVQ